jgi:hypothetical protein
MLTAHTIKNLHSHALTCLHGNLAIGATECHIALKDAMKTAVSILPSNDIRKNLTRVMKYLHLAEKEPADSPES